jgi:non-specific serine/threonine protein kinase
MARLLALALLAAVSAGCLGAIDDAVDDDTLSVAGDDRAQALESLDWRADASAPTSRTEVVAAPLEPGGSTFLVIGGFYLDTVRSRVVETYDAAEDSWSDATDYPIPVYHTAAVNVDGDVHVFGGHSTPAFAPTDLVFRYDESDERWVQETRMPVPRGAHDVAVVDGKVVVVGGYGADRETIRRVDVYDVDEGAWEQGPDLPVARDHLAAAAVGDEVYAVGGRDVSLSSNVGRLDVLALGSGSWEEGPDLPTPRGGLGAEAFDGRIVAAGGERSDGTFAAVEVLDTRNGTWTELPDMPTARHGIGTGVFDGSFHTFMGGPEPGVSRSDAVESLGPFR